MIDGVYHTTLWDCHDKIEIKCNQKLNAVVNGIPMTGNQFSLASIDNKAVFNVLIDHEDALSLSICSYEMNGETYLFNPSKTADSFINNEFMARYKETFITDLIRTKNEIKSVQNIDLGKADNIHYLKSLIDADFPVTFASRRSVITLTHKNLTYKIKVVDGVVQIIQKKRMRLFKTVTALISQLRQFLGLTFSSILSVITFKPNWKEIAKTRQILWHYITEIQSYAKHKLDSRPESEENTDLLSTDSNSDSIPIDDIQNNVASSSRGNVPDSEAFEVVLQQELESKINLGKIVNKTQIDKEELEIVIDNLTREYEERYPHMGNTDIKESIKSALAKQEPPTTFKSLVSMLYNAIQPFIKTIQAISSVMISIFRLVIPYFMDIHNLILSAPLEIIGLKGYLKNRLGYTPLLIDFFLIPISSRINYYFLKSDTVISDEEKSDILQVKLPQVTLDPSTTIKWHYAVNYAIFLFSAASIPFMMLSYIPKINNLAPIWNIAPYISSILSFPFNLMDPTVFKDENLFIVGMFPTCLYFTPMIFLRGIPSLLLDSMTTIVYGIPHFIYAMKNIKSRKDSDLPERYEERSMMLKKHNTVEILMAIPLLCDILADPYVVGPIGYLITGLFMTMNLIQSHMGILMVHKAIKWHSTYLQVNQPSKHDQI